MGRFCDSSEDMIVQETGSKVSLFSGLQIAPRMNDVRKSIGRVRRGWDDDYEFFSRLLARQFEVELETVEGGDDKSELFRKRLKAILHGPRADWGDRVASGALPDDSYHALRLYTSELGDRRVYKKIKNVFRAEPAPADEDFLWATFLVELINVDLFNLCLNEPSVRNFEGVVYRGMALKKADLAEYARIANKPDLKQRSFAVPLGLDSSSLDPQQTIPFIEEELRGAGARAKVPVIHKIHVAQPKPEVLEAYVRRFNSVVTTIGAVPLEAVSDYAEQEVLLRGPFYHLLRYEAESEYCVAGRRASLVESVMLNTNRDHHSTQAVEEANGRAARDFMIALINQRRFEFCADFCRRENLAESADYKELAGRAATTLQSLQS